MTEQAAFQATYSDFKLVRSRGVIQVVLEVPVEKSRHVLDVLGGMPNSSAEIWVGVARLSCVEARAESHPPPDNGEASHPTDAPGAALPPRRFTSLPLPQQAALLCQDSLFTAYVAREYGVGGYVNTKDDTTEWLRAQCGIKSRRELTPDSQPGRDFLKIRDRFLAWKDAA